MGWIRAKGDFYKNGKSYSSIEHRQTIDEYLGAKNIEEHLEEHSKDYLGTAYRGAGCLGWEYPQVYCYPNVEKKRPTDFIPSAIRNKIAGMNCQGFVTYIMYACGGEPNKIKGTASGGMCNLGNFQQTIVNNNCKMKSYRHLDNLIKKGKPKKGDLICYEPFDRNQDDWGHIVVYWGDKENPYRIWDSTYSSTDKKGNAFRELTDYKGRICYLHVPIKHIEAPKDNLYRVQVGAFRNKANAEKLKKEIQDKGFKAFVKKC